MTMTTTDTDTDTDITILVDNQAAPELTAEHGLALWIEAEGRPMLFDTGQGPALPANARALGVDLRTTSQVVLSHGHYDHTGGLAHVLQEAPNVHVYCHPAVVQPRYSKRTEGPKGIHMPGQARGALDRVPEKQLHWVSEATFIAKAVGLTGPIPRQTPYEDTGGPFFLDPGVRHPDPIEDDMALWIATEGGLVICVGCCHAGIINTIDHIRNVSGMARIRALIGGLHLVNAGPQRLAKTVEALTALPIDKVVACHCTGETAFEALSTALGDRFVRGKAGGTYRF